MRWAVMCFILWQLHLCVSQVTEATTPPRRLSHDERRNIAVDFMCGESHWPGMRSFCGNLPPMDGRAQ